jgi:hypothetical protein
VQISIVFIFIFSGKYVYFPMEIQFEKQHEKENIDIYFLRDVERFMLRGFNQKCIYISPLSRRHIFVNVPLIRILIYVYFLE